MSHHLCQQSVLGLSSPGQTEDRQLPLHCANAVELPVQVFACLKLAYSHQEDKKKRQEVTMRESGQERSDKECRTGCRSLVVSQRLHFVIQVLLSAMSQDARQDRFSHLVPEYQMYEMMRKKIARLNILHITLYTCIFRVK